MNTLTKARVYEPKSPNKGTGILHGEFSGILHWDDIPRPGNYESYIDSLSSHWTADQVELTQDVKQFPTLSKEKQGATKSIVGLLAGLDSAATRNMLEFLAYIKDPSFWALFAVMAKDEAEHNRAYSFITADVMTRDESLEAFKTPKSHPLLIERNEKMMNQFNSFVENKTPENFLKTIIYHTILEGLFFYSGFSFFYAMAKNRELVGMATMINYINKDELRHTRIITDVYKSVLYDYPELNTTELHQFVIDAFKESVESERTWCHHILKGIEHIDLVEIDSYLEYRANKIVGMLGYPKVYENVNENNILWIKAYEDNFAGVKTDFFENHNRNYLKVSNLNGFDDL